MVKLPDWLRVNPEPREKEYFTLLEQSAKNAVNITQQLRDVVYVWDNVKERVGVITSLGQHGETITHRILSQLKQTMITPIDREDIALLAESLGKITDAVCRITSAILSLYKLARPVSTVKEMADIVLKATVELDKALIELHGRINKDSLMTHCEEVIHLEILGDDIYRSAKVQLARESNDVFDSKEWDEVYDHMETALVSCKNTASLLEGVALKYA